MPSPDTDADRRAKPAAAAATTGAPPTTGAEHPRLGRRVAWWTLLAMVFLVPLVMTDFTLPGLQGSLAFSSLELIKLSLIRVLALVSLAAWAWDLLRNGGLVRRTPVDWLIIAWLVWVGITTITSIHWPTALLGTQGRYEGLLTFLTYALVYFLVLQLAADGNRVLRLAQALFWSSVIVSVYGLLQYAGAISLPEDLPWAETNRAFATYGNPNMLGGFLVITVTVALGLALRERKLAWRLLYWAGFGLNGLALIASFTRGAWIGGAVSLALLGIMAWRQRAKLHRADWIPAGVFGAAGIGLIVRSLFSADAVMNFGTRIASVFQFGSGSGQTRTEIWRAALSSINDRPLFGWGSDTFGLVFSKFKPADYVRDAGSASGTDNAHDYPLHLASGIGILGAVLFFAIWIWAGIRSWKTVFGRGGDASPTDAALHEGSPGASPGASERLLLGAFWAAAAGYLLHLVFGISVPGSTFLLWIALAVLLAPTARQITVKARRGGTMAAAAIIVVAALGIAGQGVVLAADRAYEIASEEFSFRSLDERAAAADQAMALNSLVPEYRTAVAALRMERMVAGAGALAQARQEGKDPTPYTEALALGLADAEAAYNNAIAFTPPDYANYVNLASVYNLAGSSLDADYYQSAIDTAERGLTVMPFGTAIRVRLAEALLATGRTAEALEALEYSMQLDPKDGSTALPLAKLYQQEGMTAEALTLLKSVEALAPGQAGVAAAIKALEKGLPMP
jgi:O-antigen ligase/tetratricopeptide (TPR) repeat protein